MEVISESSLKKLKEHKYSASGTSLVEPYMQIYWRWLVEQIPTTWAPNTLTVVGLILNVVTSSLLFMFSPDGKTEVIVYMFCIVVTIKRGRCQSCMTVTIVLPQNIALVWKSFINI